MAWSGMPDVSHLTSSAAPTVHKSPAFGDVTGGLTTMRAPRASTGVAVVVETARARAERIAVKNCIVKAWLKGVHE